MRWWRMKSATRGATSTDARPYPGFFCICACTRRYSSLMTSPFKACLSEGELDGGPRTGRGLAGRHDGRRQVAFHIVKEQVPAIVLRFRDGLDAVERVIRLEEG